MRLRRYGVCGALISLLVFSFSSYPLHLPAFIVAGICLLLACGIGDVIGKYLILCVARRLYGKMDARKRRLPGLDECENTLSFGGLRSCQQGL